MLKYINNESSRFKVFFANCVSEILKSSHPAQWRYVNTASNAADVTSRGFKVEAFLKDILWLMGPPFLCQPETERPVNPEPVSHLSQDNPEVKKSVVTTTLLGPCAPSAETLMPLQFTSRWQTYPQNDSSLMNLHSPVWELIILGPSK